MYIKLIATSICSTMLLLLAACNSITMEMAMKEAESIDLFYENIDGITVGKYMSDDALLTFEKFTPHPHNDDYASQRNYDHYWNKNFILSVDRKTKEILQFSVLEDNITATTEKGITLESSLEEVIQAYGEDYFIYEDREQTIYILGYVDHPNNLTIYFGHFDGKVTGITFGYAFDRMKWEQQ